MKLTFEEGVKVIAAEFRRRGYQCLDISVTYAVAPEEGERWFATVTADLEGACSHDIEETGQGDSAAGAMTNLWGNIQRNYGWSSIMLWSPVDAT